MGRKKKKHTVASSKKSQPGKNGLKDKESLLLKVCKPEILLTGIFLLALAIRLIYLSQVIHTPIFHGLVADTEKYDSFALHILKGNFTHKDFIYLNPLYPFFLAFIYLIGGHSHFAVAFIQALIDSISSVLIYFIASTLFNKKVGIIAAFTYACYGIAVFYTGILLAPTVVIFLTLLFIASLIFAEQRGKVFIFFISGIFFGLAGLARPNVILFLFLLPIWFFTLLKNRLGIYKSIQGFLLLLVGFLMVLSLISIRNYSIEKRFSPFSVQGGLNFYIGNNPEATGYFMSPCGISSSPIDQVKTSIRYTEKTSGKNITPSQASSYWLLKGLTFIRDNPIDASSLYMEKFALFWRKEELPLNIDYSLSKNFASIFRLPFISFGIIAPFALLGIILTLRKRNNLLLILLFIFSYMASVIIFFVSARYRLLIAPFLIICSSYFLYRFAEMIRAQETKGMITSSILLVLLLAGVNAPFKHFKRAPASLHYSNLGMIYHREGRLDEAVSALKQAISTDPYCIEAYYNLGNVYTTKGLIKEAIDEYKKALKLNPDFAEAHNNLGMVYGKKGLLDKAISEFNNALAINPNYAEAYYNRGTACGKKGLLNAAISDFKKALSINPDYPEAFYNLGLAYSRKGMNDEAALAFKKGIALNPGLADAYKKSGLASENK